MQASTTPYCVLPQTAHNLLVCRPLCTHLDALASFSTMLHPHTSIPTMSHTLQVAVFEAHTVAGGAAHCWSRRGCHFDSGTALFFGLPDRRQQQQQWPAAVSGVWPHTRTTSSGSGSSEMDMQAASAAAGSGFATAAEIAGGGSNAAGIITHHSSHTPLTPYTAPAGVLPAGVGLYRTGSAAHNSSCLHTSPGTSNTSSSRGSCGKSSSVSDNPLHAVLTLLGETLDLLPYGPDRTWLVFPEGTFKAQVGGYMCACMCITLRAYVCHCQQAG